MVLWIRVCLFGGLSSDPVILFACSGIMSGGGAVMRQRETSPLFLAS